MRYPLIFSIFVLFLQTFALPAAYSQNSRQKDSLDVVQLLTKTKKLPKDSLETVLLLNRQSLSLAKKLQSPRLLAQAYHTNGISQYWAGNFEAAFISMDSSFLYSSALQDTSAMDLVLYKKGLLKYNQADFKAAEVIFTEGLRLMEKYSLKEDFKFVRQYNALGVVNRKLERADKAIVYFNKALGHIQEDNSMKAGLLSNLKNLYLKEGILDSALSLSYQALHMLEQEDNYDGMIFLLCEISNIHKRLEDFERSEKTIKRALFLSKQKNIREHDYYIYKRMGNFFEIKDHDLDSALYYHRLALQNIAKEDTLKLISSWLEMGDVFTRLNQADSATFFLMHVLDFHRKGKNKGYSYIRALELLARTKVLQGETDSAIALLDTALLLANQSSARTLLPNIYVQLSKLHEEKGHVEQAFFYYKKYTELKDSIFNASVFQTQQSIEDQKEIREKERALEFQYLNFKNRKKTYARLLWGGSGLAILLIAALYLRMRNNFRRRLSRLTALLGDQIDALRQSESSLAELRNQEEPFPAPYYEEVLQELETLHQLGQSFRETSVKTSPKKAKTVPREDDLQLYFYLVSHDLKNYLLQMRSQVENPESPVLQTLNQLDDFLKQVTEFSNLEKTDLFFSPVYIPDLIKDIERSLGSKWEKSHLKLEVQETFPSVKADAFLLRQLLVNLIDNAVKYARPGVSPCVRIDWQTEAQNLVLVISDNGPGIPEPETAFQPFVRQNATASQTGSGLGLAIVRKIVELHGGSIQVKNAEGGGTSFYIRFCL